MTLEPPSKKVRVAEALKAPAAPASLEAKVTLPNGLQMPYVGLGTYLQTDNQAQSSVEHALKCGYRHIDTAEFYANQTGIAKGIASRSVARSELFITDKLNPGGIFGQPGKSYADTIQTLKKTLELLQTSYVDLYLIHHPGAKKERLEQWRALCDAQKEGLAKAIGVSNFSEKHIEEIRAAGMKLPEVNQIEIHPLCTQTPLLAYLRANNIQPIAYSSLAPCSGWRVEDGQGSAKSEKHTKQMALLDALASKHRVSHAQVLLRWALQKGYPILPKSSQPARVEANAQLFHFELDAEEIAQLDALDEDSALAWPVGNPLNWE